MDADARRAWRGFTRVGAALWFVHGSLATAALAVLVGGCFKVEPFDPGGDGQRADIAGDASAALDGAAEDSAGGGAVVVQDGTGMVDAGTQDAADAPGTPFPDTAASGDGDTAAGSDASDASDADAQDEFDAADTDVVDVPTVVGDALDGSTGVLDGEDSGETGPGPCVPTDPCAATECQGSDVWCIDDCGNPDHVKEACGAPGCGEGACKPPPPESACDDGVDNDGDGLTDCADSDCAVASACTVCVPNDSCASVACEGSDVWCIDDCGKPDHVQEVCGAPGCAGGACKPPLPESACDDGVDNDGDGATDCADSDCAGALACTVCVPNDSCASVACEGSDVWCIDDCGKPDHVQEVCGAAGCAGGACKPPPPESACDDGVDNDGDGLTDCADSDCAVASACTVCVPNDSCASVACEGSDVWCIDDCGKPDHVQEVCGAAGCAGGACKLPPGYVLIPSGTFTMGSPPDEPGRGGDEGQHTVVLTHAFYLKATEVTQAEWAALMGNNPSVFSGCDNCPAERVNWYEALAYANARSQAEGLAACYTLSGCSGAPGEGMTCSKVEVNAPSGNPYLCQGYRLPTEAEWEYACRAGTTTAFYNGPILYVDPDCGDDANLDAIGWYCGNAGGHTHPVAQKAPNAWGLYDMAGNVWEWCWDWYGAYTASPVTDPLGPESGSYRVERGGSWNYFARGARVASRYGSAPGACNADVGFRLARTVNP